jgi:hypothetical protein
MTPPVLDAEAERIIGRRLWSAMMLARSFAVLESILLGRPVLVRLLDPEALRRARRGMPAPPPTAFIRLRHGHLDAMAECGPLTGRRRAA